MALATSLSASCNAFLLYRKLYQQGVYQFSSFSQWFALKCIASSMLMAVLVYFVAQQYTWQSWSLIEQVILLCALLAVAMVSYFGALLTFGVRLKTIKEVSA